MTLPKPVRPLEGHGLAPVPLTGRQLLLPAWGGFFGLLES